MIPLQSAKFKCFLYLKEVDEKKAILDNSFLAANTSSELYLQFKAHLPCKFQAR